MIFPEPATLFDDYEGRGYAAKNQDMTILHTMTMGGDVKAHQPERQAELAKIDPDDPRALTKLKYQSYMRDFLACIAGVDENVGKILYYYYQYYEFPAYWHAVRRHEGVSTDRYKLIRFYGNDVPNGEEFEFYDLQADPHELTSVYGTAQYAAEIADLKAEPLRLRKVYEVPDDVGGLPVKPIN